MLLYQSKRKSPSSSLPLLPPVVYLRDNIAILHTSSSWSLLAWLAHSLQSPTKRGDEIPPFSPPPPLTTTEGGKGKRRGCEGALALRTDFFKSSVSRSKRLRHFTCGGGGGAIFFSRKGNVVRK